MATNADLCRARAAECDQLSKQTKNPVARQRYIDMARAWRELAKYAESGDRKSVEPKTTPKVTKYAAA